MTAIPVPAQVVVIGWKYAVPPRQKAREGEPFSVRFTLPTDRVLAEEARRTRRSKSAVD